MIAMRIFALGFDLALGQILLLWIIVNSSVVSLIQDVQDQGLSWLRKTEFTDGK
jgi:hypothetical protein